MGRRAWKPQRGGTVLEQDFEVSGLEATGSGVCVVHEGPVQAGGHHISRDGTEAVDEDPQSQIIEGDGIGQAEVCKNRLWICGMTGEFIY